MTDKNGRILSKEEIKAIEATLDKGDRVELIPVKDGIRVMRVKRETLKPK